MTPNYIESLSSLFQENDSLKKSVEKINREYERQKEALIKTTEEFIRANHLYLELNDIQIASIDSDSVQIKHPLFFQNPLQIAINRLSASLHGYSTIRLKFYRLYMIELNQRVVSPGGHTIWVSYLTVPPIEPSDYRPIDISLKPLLDQYPAYTKKE